jgi:hypothetical protein
MDFGHSRFILQSERTAIVIKISRLIECTWDHWHLARLVPNLPRYVLLTSCKQNSGQALGQSSIKGPLESDSLCSSGLGEPLD